MTNRRRVSQKKARITSATPIRSFVLGHAGMDGGLARSTTRIVDGSEADLRLLDRQLQHYDLATDRAGHAGQAIALLSSQAFGFVFLDTDLGGPAGLDGLALCRQIAHHELAVRGPMPALVLVSAHHSPTDQVRAALAGADALLGKPLDLTALDRLLQRHGLRRAADDAGPAAPAEPAPPAPPPTQ